MLFDARKDLLMMLLDIIYKLLALNVKHKLLYNAHALLLLDIGGGSLLLYDGRKL